MSHQNPVLPAEAEEIEQSRLYSVTHTTVYRYASPVYRSSHLFRLRPVHDRFQEVLRHELVLSVDGTRTEFEDVFGNEVVHTELIGPYDELRIEASSLVRVHTGDRPSAHERADRHTSIPIVWMPWESQMMLPYLLPPELVESELKELSDYARSLVERNRHDLTATLIDLTRTLHNEMAYEPGATQLETTPYEVYRSKRGVCQDFANLFTCLARLERVPARYRVGYVYTGGNYENRIQAEASHAWAEAYLPWHGWRGFDPTNGVPTDLDHIRVATGRNFRDAAPTSGVITEGGGAETLEVSVQVQPIEER